MELVIPDYSLLEKSTTNSVPLELYKYWDGKRNTRKFPSRTDINPLEFVFALSWLSLVNVGVEPRSFHYRLVSTSLTERLGYEMTGKSADEIPEDDVRQYVIDFYGRAVAARMPVFEKSARIFQNRIWEHEALVLPLSSDGETIDLLMVYRITHKPQPLPRWAQTDHPPM